MCGIAGLVGPEATVETVQAMIATLRHRGPDGEGVWRSPTLPVVLGHRRLAIVDLSPTGEQPMTVEEDRFAITYNGELYNTACVRRDLAASGVSFRGTSDTEVLLQAWRHWGAGALQRISGMYAFAAVDADAQILYLARDRCGQKPLYYCQRGDTFAFASEIKAFHGWRDDLRSIHPEGLEEYLAYGFPLGAKTLTKGVQRLLPGELLIYHLQTRRVETRFHWEASRQPGRRELGANWETELEHLLEDAVERHLAADVPVGILLSGGIDSSLITALASRTHGGVKTFTAMFSDSPELNEAPAARSVAKHCHCEHIELEIQGCDFTLIESLARQFDVPIADHAIVPTYLVAEALSHHVKVALTGDGGDELFGGYGANYAMARRQSRVRAVPRALRTPVSRAAQRFLRAGVTGRNHLIGLQGRIESAIAHVNLYFDGSMRRQLGYGSYSPESTKTRLLETFEGDSIDKAMANDFVTTLPFGYLVKSDRASMLASVEFRAPLLDDQILSYAMTLPHQVKFANGRTKVLLRKLAARLLPPEISERQKQGFTMPLRDWLRTERGGWFKEILLSPDQTLFEKKPIRGLFDDHHRGCDNAGRIFALVMLVLWAKAYRMSL